MKNSEDLFAKMAEIYADELGKETKEQAKGPFPLEIEASARNLNAKIKPEKRKKPIKGYFGVAGAIAAGILAVMIFANILPALQDNSVAGTADESPSSSMSESDSNSAESEWNETTNGASTTEDNSPEDTASVPGEAPAPEYKLIPLMALPADFTINEVEQDKEKSIYYLSTPVEDEIILTMKEGSDEPQGLETVKYSGKDVYINTTEDYYFMAFASGDIWHELTFKYDLTGAEELVRSIIEQDV